MPQVSTVDRQPQSKPDSDANSTNVGPRTAMVDRRMRGLLVTLSICFLWAYGPTLYELYQVWEREPDYSHGILVIPLAIFFLYLRRDLLPPASNTSDSRSNELGGCQASPRAPIDPGMVGWWGLAIMAVALAVRYTGLRFSFDPLDGYSLILWLAGCVLLLGGWRVLWWALPCIGFLFFMVPLPFQAEQLLSVPLQRIATHFSCFLLQCLGQPAFAEGTTIILASQRMGVEEACSGLRIFMGTFALAVAYIIATRRELWEKSLLICGVIPIALVANALRIVTTALLYRYGSSQETARRFNHDFAGWLMIGLAAGMFALLLTYLSFLVRRVDMVSLRDVVARRQSDV